ncbi:hypothetical protein BD410DRAFT_809268 [Rickenella mellea]|uniref:SRCR domain-containing protein n=1 Tax=Rickenella mellea TaxID=50990 RepID=A0A4Y7PIE0_9AGAM|nr:hypothetical protein BD410DRAFT_809268 [Rickenella mellea]
MPSRVPWPSCALFMVHAGCCCAGCSSCALRVGAGALALFQLVVGGGSGWVRAGCRVFLANERRGGWSGSAGADGSCALRERALGVLVGSGVLASEPCGCSRASGAAAGESGWVLGWSCALPEGASGGALRAGVLVSERWGGCCVLASERLGRWRACGVAGAACGSWWAAVFASGQCGCGGGSGWLAGAVARSSSKRWWWEVGRGLACVGLMRSLPWRRVLGGFVRVHVVREGSCALGAGFGGVGGR